MLMSYGLQFFVAIELVWGNVSKYFKNQFRGEIIVRLLAALFTCKSCVPSFFIINELNFF